MMLLLRSVINLRDEVDLYRKKMKDYDNEEQKQVEKIQWDEIEQRNKNIQKTKMRIRIQTSFSLSIDYEETDDITSQIEEQLLNNEIDNSKYAEEICFPIMELNSIDTNNGLEADLKDDEFYLSKEIQLEPIKTNKQNYLDPSGLIMLILIYLIAIVIILMKIFL